MAAYLYMGFIEAISHLLTFDPNLLGHPSTLFWQLFKCLVDLCYHERFLGKQNLRPQNLPYLGTLWGVLLWRDDSPSPSPLASV